MVIMRIIGLSTKYGRNSKMKTSAIIQNSDHASYRNRLFRDWDCALPALRGIFIQNVVRILISDHLRTYGHR